MKVSRVYLQAAATGQLVPADLCDKITDRHLDLWETSWQPAMEAHCAGLPRDAEPEDSEWNWRANAKIWRKLATFRSYAVVCNGELQGLMVVRDTLNASGMPVIYVELLATAPWNRPEISTPPRYRGTGRVLIAAAIALSRAEGYGGRIGLHSLPAAEPFYRDKCGMMDLGMDAAKGMVYFEMSEAQANAFP